MFEWSPESFSSTLWSMNQRKSQEGSQDDKKNDLTPLPGLLLLEAILFAFVEEISLRAAQVNNLGTSIPILLLNCTLFTVICIRYSRSSTDNTSSLIRPVITFVTNSNESRRTNVWVTDDTLAITLLTETTNGYSWLFAAKNQVWMMLCHSDYFLKRLLKWCLCRSDVCRQKK